MTANLRKTTFKTLLLILAATLTIALINRSNSAEIFITLNVSKQTYSIGDQASIWGNVTFSAGVGGGLVPDALVAIEVDNPKGIPVILRTRTTGFPPTASEIIVLDLTPCDQTGNPLTNFKNGTLAYFKISLNNTSASPKPAEITLNIFDGRNLAYETFTAFKGLLYSGTTNLLISDPIPQDIPNGTATAYLDIFTALPSVGGFAYCPEKSTTFVIGSPLPMWSPGPHPPSGFYNLTFLIDNYVTTRPFRHGNYSVFANCKYETETASASTTFEIVLTGDINRDGAVDIYDAILLANTFGTKLGDPRWNPNADLNQDGKVDIYDAIILANHYGNKA